ncbi:AraC family transcriptional regulator [Cytophagaceae bacterium DM2B3-1]|uniref:AraC family transcriptional regulator n=1 Tax=Xanthocytophaga flava TaxID=3048013 RepID=A0AAE3QYY9_9BACT|nr:AraC family transcriptional regulator [Xanthocytophaga flavus]MDJ1472619.1 AraC family transcriptional regulator [Xanthocytophaga flavus]MDJ1485078.1 AraC family transcriptional regulator [Xanthocytophaga flavus]MDJ1497969.1 AraC family transcriptional regulator [Xanthocytophaga flavus]
MGEQTKDLGGIIYSTYTDANRSGEQFIHEHHLAYIISGSLSIIDGGRTDTFNAGDIVLLRKNNLGKFIKQPAKDGHFIAITILLDNETLVNASKGQQLAEEVYASSQAVLSIGPDVLLTNYFHSLLPYFEEVLTEDLIHYKKQEAILLLLRCNPSLKNILFDFGVPGKIDLEEFMNRNFRYNVSLDKFAYLTGRSLASFKRDFEKIFNTSPNRWIQQRRLKEAHYLIREKKLKPSDVYLEVGFESLSHFSYSFKQFFGKNPSSL